MLAGMWERGTRPKLIITADVGFERPEIYQFRPIFDDWLESSGKGSELGAGHHPDHCEEMEPMNIVVDMCLLPIGAGVILRRNSAAELVSPEWHSGGHGARNCRLGDSN